METRLRLLLHDAGAPPPTSQHEARGKDGRLVGRVGLAYPRWRIAIEYEGDHHRERAQFRPDVARADALRDAGWLVLRFTADDLLRNPNGLITHVAKAIKERR
jgi:very-short-patch-repair endonuclease